MVLSNLYSRFTFKYFKRKITIVLERRNFIPSQRQDSIEPYNSGKEDLRAVVGQAIVLAALDMGDDSYVIRRNDAQLLEDFLR